MKHFVRILVLLLSVQIANAQEFEVPKNYILTKKEDYKKYEQDILKCIEWLENTPFDSHHYKRKEAYKFLLTWLTGCPYVTIEIDGKILKKFTKKNPELLMIFMGGWAKYSIEHPDDKDLVNGNMAGIKSVIKVYKQNKGKGLKEDKKIEKIIKLENKGELKNWVRKQLK